MEENIRISEAGGFDFLANPDAAREIRGSHGIGFTLAMRYAAKYPTWVNRVREYGEWDYKRLQDDHEVFQDFGNFNFGLTGAANAIPLDKLLWGAGTIQGAMDTALGRPGPANPTQHGDHPRDDQARL